jgi:hypothetical protein
LIDGPAVWRQPGVLQVGLGPRHLVLTNVPDNVADAIELFDGQHSRADIAATLDAGWGDWLCGVLDDNDALAEGPAVRPRCRVAVVGDGALATAVARRLVCQGVTLDSQRPDLVVVAPPRAEADRVAVRGLTEAGLPHLVTALGFGQATLGPFVLPGVTACLNCVDLTRREADPAWPLIAFQIAQMTPRDDPLLADWLAAGVATQVAAHLAGRLPQTCWATAVFDRADLTPGWAQWPARPECPCGASG